MLKEIFEVQDYEFQDAFYFSYQAPFEVEPLLKINRVPIIVMGVGGNPFTQ